MGETVNRPEREEAYRRKWLRRAVISGGVAVVCALGMKVDGSLTNQDKIASLEADRETIEDSLDPSQVPYFRQLAIPTDTPQSVMQAAAVTNGQERVYFLRQEYDDDQVRIKAERNGEETLDFIFGIVDIAALYAIKECLKQRSDSARAEAREQWHEDLDVTLDRIEARRLQNEQSFGIITE